MAATGVSLVATYDPALVVISILIAIGASYTALDLAERVTSAKGSARRMWLLAGASSMGLGIWSMHFTGMLAFRLPVELPGTYDVALTLLSMLVAILASGLALFLVSQPVLGTLTLLTGGTIMGGAIVSMHYTGMAAMRVPCVLSYDPLLFSASVLIAVVASVAALWLCFRLRTERIGMWSWSKVAGAGVMGIAIAGMHYTGMAAGSYTPFCAPPTLSTAVINISDLGTSALAFGTLLMLSIVLISSHKARLQWQQEVMKDRFLGVLSHELRTPINAITGFASILEDGLAGPLTDEQRQYVHKILDGSDRLLALVDDLLDLSRLQAGKFTLSLDRVPLGEVIQEASSTLAPMANQKAITVEARVPPELQPVWGDRQRIGQVLLNLVNNAIKFTDPGGRIELTARADGRCVRVEVADNGIGIAEHDIARLFQPFSQLDMSTTRVAGGTGLGLSISKGLVEAQGGAIGVASRPGVGSTFWFTLPLAPPS